MFDISRLCTPLSPSDAIRGWAAELQYTRLGLGENPCGIAAAYYAGVLLEGYNGIAMLLARERFREGQLLLEFHALRAEAQMCATCFDAMAHSTHPAHRKTREHLNHYTELARELVVLCDKMF